MKASFLKIFLAAYLLLAITFIITYNSSMESTSRSWERISLNLPGMCRVVGEPVPLRISGLYRMDFPEGVHIVTPGGTITEPGKIEVTTRGVYIEFTKPINESVQVKIEAVPDWKGAGLALIASLVGGVVVASAFRILGLE
ncbi:hypothetical protein [Thermococcus waiotapuensis]|uniref:Uncharacterized protein n=1 Tax=Thermococcus waiotapuensis TaxID=90909 RepID=A0AAE4NWJ1_9EURY|nr:hypothetical protein [Thermococcus waiotapuensis]MDV3103997.1 hypothetical protein [Thermococcus waiotapuensis]